MIFNKKIKELENDNKYLQDKLFQSEIKREDLMNIIKAIINKFDRREIMISRQELANAEEFKIFVTKDLTHNAKIYRTVCERELLDSYKEENK